MRSSYKNDEEYEVDGVTSSYRPTAEYHDDTDKVNHTTKHTHNQAYSQTDRPVQLQKQTLQLYKLDFENQKPHQAAQPMHSTKFGNQSCWNNLPVIC